VELPVKNYYIFRNGFQQPRQKAAANPDIEQSHFTVWVITAGEL
jgi:hypothetical protein